MSNPAVSLSATSTVNYSGSGLQTISAQNYGNLTTSTGGTKTLAGTVTVSGNVTSRRRPVHFKL